MSLKVHDLHSRLLRLAANSNDKLGEDTQGLGKEAASLTSRGIPNPKTSVQAFSTSVPFNSYEESNQI